MSLLQTTRLLNLTTFSLDDLLLYSLPWNHGVHPSSNYMFMYMIYSTRVWLSVILKGGGGMAWACVLRGHRNPCFMYIILRFFRLFSFFLIPYLVVFWLVQICFDGELITIFHCTANFLSVAKITSSLPSNTVIYCVVLCSSNSTLPSDIDIHSAWASASPWAFLSRLLSLRLNWPFSAPPKAWHDSHYVWF